VSTSTVLAIAPRTVSTLRSSLTFALVSLVAYGFSFAKSVVVARYFGTGSEMDAFTLAAVIPNLLATLLLNGFAVSLVPALANAESKGKEERANTFRAALVLFTAAGCVLVVILVMFSREIMAAVAPKFNNEKQIMAAELLRWCAPLLPLNAVYALCSGELLSRRRYWAVAAAPLISSVVSLLVIVGFSRKGVAVLAIGLVAGTAVQAAAVFWPAWRANLLDRTTRLWTPEVRGLCREQLPLLLVSGLSVINVSVDQFMAGLLPSGSASALNFAATLNMVVTQTVVMAASWVVLPELSELAAKGNRRELAAKVRQGILGLTLAAIPAIILIFLYGGPGVRILFQHGRFDATSTRQVSAIWIGYTCGLLPFALSIVPVRLLNALRKNTLLVRVGLVALPINAGLDYLLMQKLGPVGISLSTSSVYFCTASVIIFFAARLVPGILDRKLGGDILRALAISLAGGMLLYAFSHIFSLNLISIIVGSIFFSAVVLALYYYFRLVHFSTCKAGHGAAS
jgi:putative peptidoglycan lipid II flippase